jgi:general secretion pathway protein D
MTVAPGLSAQETAQDTAINRAVMNQADRLTLRQKLADARSAQERRDLTKAATLYGDAWGLAQQIGFSNIEAEVREVRQGIIAVRTELAKQAQRQGNYAKAQEHISFILAVDPTNVAALEFKRANDKLLKANLGKGPSQETADKVAAISEEKAKVNTLVHDGRVLFEMGKLEAAKAKLDEAIHIDPQNQAAYYYLNLITEAKLRENLNKRDTTAKQKLGEIEGAWANPTAAEKLQSPNPYNRTNLIFTSHGRQAIFQKLNTIRLDNVRYENLPLAEVVNMLNDETRRRDPSKQGINYMINPNAEGTVVTTTGMGLPGMGMGMPGAGAVDPATGLPAATGPTTPTETTDLGNEATVTIMPPLMNVRLLDVLDAIAKVSKKPIKYVVEDYAVVFSSKSREQEALFYRTFKVDPNTFWQGLEQVAGFDFSTMVQNTGSGSSGGGGNQSGSMVIPRVELTTGTITSGGGGGGSGRSQGSQQGGGQQGAVTGGGNLGPTDGTPIFGSGLRSVTRQNMTTSSHTAVRAFFNTMGVNLNPPKCVFFNDREGSMIVRATMQDLDIIEMAIQVLNIAPPQINIKSKFVEVTQNDSKALGFSWYLGNFMMNNNISASGGSQPSLSDGKGGVFPGNQAAGTSIASSTSDGMATGGLRNQLNAPTLGTFTGILTDPQFRLVINALDQRDGTDLLNEAEVTTLSGRQTEIQVVDIQSIVMGNSSQNQTGGGGSSLNGNNSSSATVTITPTTSVIPLGPTLDVLPYVCADGYTIQMTILPSIMDFMGYDNPGQFVTQTAFSSGSSGATLTAQLPLPHFRVRQVTTSAIVWDGQTVVLGGLITESVSKYKDKIPMLGDLPVVGRLFRSESSSTSKKNLMIFVTPTIIDPAGNRAHSDEEMPFAQTSIPKQTRTTPAAPVVQ